MSSHKELFQEALNKVNALYEEYGKWDTIISSDIEKILDDLEAKIEAANQWLPFDPENIPEAKEGWCLLINVPSYRQSVASFTFKDLEWVDSESDGFYNYTFGNNCTYKLVPLT
jgi:hypothetical protein